MSWTTCTGALEMPLVKWERWGRRWNMLSFILICHQRSVLLCFNWNIRNQNITSVLFHELVFAEFPLSFMISTFRIFVQFAYVSIVINIFIYLWIYYVNFQLGNVKSHQMALEKLNQFSNELHLTEPLIRKRLTNFCLMNACFVIPPTIAKQRNRIAIFCLVTHLDFCKIVS